jgi:NB-ARC domain/TIR domain/WD domain, G-beta repeat/APAF-1 helical domain
MASDPPKVLISYSHDSPEHEQRVLELANRLRADGIDCTIDQYVVAPAEGWPRWMDKQIRDSDFVVMVCSETYYRRVMGEEAPGKGLGVRWEGHLVYQAIYSAESTNTKFIPVLFESGNYAHIPAPVQSTTFYFAQTEDGYEDLYRRLTKQPCALKPVLGKLLSLPPAERKSEGALARLVNVPGLPAHFLPRLGDFQALKDAMLAGLTKPVALTGTGKIGVQGMGGIGKTVLAAALAHDSEVRQAFPDGIYWLTVGQQPNLLDLQNQLLRQLAGSKEMLTTAHEAKDALREALEGRAALLVVDDAWTIDHACAFSVTALPARLLITTRNNEVLVGLGAEEHRVDVLSPSDALTMLAEWVGEKSPDKLPAEAAEVAKECGYLPLALAMIGAMIRLRPTAWKDALGRLHRADLEAVKRNFPGYPYPDLLRAIEVSLEGLELADWERYLDLAVFPEDQSIPEEALRVLWNLDEVNTRDCMTRFAARSLATWSVTTAGQEALALHDLQRDLIHKRREKELPGLHLRLVEAWDALPKLDSYAWRWVGYHLVQADRKDDLRRLLLNFNYLEAKLTVTDTNALIADYDYLPEDKDLRLVQSAIRLSAHVLVRDRRQLAGQLIGRSLGNKTPSIRVLLKQAARGKVWPWLRPLTPTLTPPGGPLIRILAGHTDWVIAVALTPDGRRALSGSWDRTLRLWDLENGQTIRTLEGHTNSVWGVAITPDGRLAVSASRDQTLRLWDFETGQTIRTLEGHTGSVWAVAVTPDGRHAVSASGDRTLRLWDLESGQTIRRLEGHTEWIRAVAVTPDGRHAVSASEDRTLRLWDLSNGQSLRTLEGEATNQKHRKWWSTFAQLRNCEGLQ